MELTAELNSSEIQIDTLESEVNSFAQSLPYWLQFLSEKLLNGTTIDEPEIEQACSFFLEDAGLLDKSERPSITINYTDSGSTAFRTNLSISKLQNIEGVNALVEKQVVEFSPHMTVVYGINGSGKSSYIRLLKKAFRTKATEDILPNIHLENGHKSTKAEFIFKSGKSSFSRNYPDDLSKSEFQQFSVFDSKCAPVHLNNKNAFEFRPVGLCYFADLTEVIKKVEEKINASVVLKSAVANFTNFFDGESEIKKQLSEISSKTDKSKLRLFLSSSDVDKDLKSQLEQQKATLLLLKVDKEIAIFQEKQKQVEVLKSQLIHINKFLTSEQLTKAYAAISDCILKENNARKNSIEDFKSNKIKGIGSDEWKALVEAAEAFSLKQIEEDSKSYPNTDDNCLLCHQPLSIEAQKLLSSYWAYIKSEAELEAKNAQLVLDKAKASYEKLDFSLLSDNHSLTQWLKDNHTKEFEHLFASINSQKELVLSLIDDLINKRPEVREQIQTNVDGLDSILEELNDSINKLRAKDPSIEINKVDKQLTLINHKEKLVQHITSIEKYIENLRWAESATSAKNKIPKRKITEKEKELSKKYFNQAYIDTFNDFSKSLNGNFNVEINHTGSGGASYRQLMLKGKQPSQVLSEGEQKVISLADFLAEMQISGINRGIIFDDPVTSLDNERKKTIAECLTKESKQRQVIIFTHDLVFFYHLKNFAKAHLKGITDSFIHHTLVKGESKYCGKVILNFSPANEGQYTDAKKAIEWLEKSRIVPGQEQIDCIKSGYSAIRASYEALAIFIIMGGVVQRFDPQIRIGRLRDLKVNKDLIERVIEKHGEISDLIEGHLPSDEYGITPDAEMLENQIQEFVSLREEFKKLNLN